MPVSGLSGNTDRMDDRHTIIVYNIFDEFATYDCFDIGFMIKWLWLKARDLEFGG